MISGMKRNHILKLRKGISLKVGKWFSFIGNLFPFPFPFPVCVYSVSIWQGLDDQEERMKNKKYRNLKMFPSDIVLKFKNIVKLLKLKKHIFKLACQYIFMAHINIYSSINRWKFLISYKLIPSKIIKILNILAVTGLKIIILYKM